MPTSSLPRRLRPGAGHGPALPTRLAAPGQAARLSERPFAACAAAFLLAAAVIAGLQAGVEVTRGWWLVAYLALVGGVAQLLLGPGLGTLARHADARPPGPLARRAELALWNAGTVAVAVADLVGADAGVVAGSVVLLVALALFAADLRRVRATGRRRASRWERGYVVLLVFLAASVAVGTGLAGALPA
jgi:hypothetical protein